MAVCDITRLDSLTALSDWIPSGLEIAGDVPVYILVNKKDLMDRRAFDDEAIKKAADAFGAPWVMTSAKTGEFVEEAFNALAIEIVDRAMRTLQTKAVERGLRDKILVLLAKRGMLGLKKNQFFDILRGLSYDELQRELTQLERDGLVVVTWHSPAEFTAAITKRGVEAAKISGAPLEE